MRTPIATAASCALVVVMLTACAAGDPRFTADAPAGFWIGIWHGLIAPVTFVIGLFDDHVEIYERANAGGWYDFGFLLGILCLGGGSHAGRGRPRAATCARAEGSPP